MLRKLSAVVTYGLVLYLSISSLASAQVVNGGFEDGTFSGWTIEYATYQGGGTFSPWLSGPPPGHPAPTIIDADTAPQPGQDLDVDPYAGDFMARINDISGGRHATKLSQTVALADGGCGKVLEVQWGAMLVEPNPNETPHTAAEQPFFQIQITSPGLASPIYDVAAEGPDPGTWVEAGEVGGSLLFYLEGLESFNLCGRNLGAGAVFEIALIAADCSKGAHGGFAYVDVIQLVDYCGGVDCPTGLRKPIPEPAIPNAFTPNGDGLNDVWGIFGVTFACKIDALIFNRWGNLIHVFTTPCNPRGYENDFVPLWNGLIGGEPVEIGEYYYILHLENCDEIIRMDGPVFVIL